MVVLGYLRNTTKRFSLYVSRRVGMILKVTDVSQWRYVRTDNNPADIASRPQTHDSLLNSTWFRGPPFLWKKNLDMNEQEPLPVDLPEIKDPKILKTSFSSLGLFESICSRVNSYNKAINVLTLVLSFISKLCKSSGTRFSQLGQCRRLENLAIELSQTECYPKLQTDLQLNGATGIPNELRSLSLFLDSDSIIRVGGRLEHSTLPVHVKHPALIPANHSFSRLILDHYHRLINHQGRHITHGAVREGGFYLQNGSKLIKTFISSCVTCRKLRAQPDQQKMADLPSDRLAEGPPFTYVGMDVFGPYIVTEGKSTRRSTSNRKAWGLIFTCLVSRAVHVEILPALDTSTFKNALRRFFSIRGVCRILRSDQGTNFVGALNIDSLNFSDVKAEIDRNQCQWLMNPPKASHFGGVWERKIGSLRRIIDFCFQQLGNRRLTSDELSTFFHEAAAIINNTPMWEVSGDPNDPFPLTPAMLLTLKDDPNPPPFEEFDESDLIGYGRRRYRRAQYLSEQFWSLWKSQYIHSLQPRFKWTQQVKSLSKGDVVMMKEKSCKRNCWPLAVVSDVKISSDGLVRSVTLRLSSKQGKSTRLLVRPACDVVLLLKR